MPSPPGFCRDEKRSPSRQTWPQHSKFEWGSGGSQPSSDQGARWKADGQTWAVRREGTLTSEQAWPSEGQYRGWEEDDHWQARKSHPRKWDMYSEDSQPSSDQGAHWKADGQTWAVPRDGPLTSEQAWPSEGQYGALEDYDDAQAWNSLPRPTLCHSKSGWDWKGFQPRSDQKAYWQKDGQPWKEVAWKGTFTSEQGWPSEASLDDWQAWRSPSRQTWHPSEGFQPISKRRKAFDPRCTGTEGLPSTSSSHSVPPPKPAMGPGKHNPESARSCWQAVVTDWFLKQMMTECSVLQVQSPRASDHGSASGKEGLQPTQGGHEADRGQHCNPQDDCDIPPPMPKRQDSGSQPPQVMFQYMEDSETPEVYWQMVDDCNHSKLFKARHGAGSNGITEFFRGFYTKKRKRRAEYQANMNEFLQTSKKTGKTRRLRQVHVTQIDAAIDFTSQPSKVYVETLWWQYKSISGWKTVDHATNRHLIEAWTSESDILKEKIVVRERHFRRSGQAFYRFFLERKIVVNCRSEKIWPLRLVAIDEFF